MLPVNTWNCDNISICCPQEVEYQSINSELIIDLISLEQLTDEKMKLRDLSFYIEPHRMVRLNFLCHRRLSSLHFQIRNLSYLRTHV
jgi:hypothetical protein